MAALEYPTIPHSQALEVEYEVTSLHALPRVRAWHAAHEARAGAAVVAAPVYHRQAPVEFGRTDVVVDDFDDEMRVGWIAMLIALYVLLFLALVVGLWHIGRALWAVLAVLHG